MSQRRRADELQPQEISVKCLSSDYDGTIGPIAASRVESRVPLRTRVTLREIGSLLPISIITMKDLSFIVPRTPFAKAWSAIGGLEMRVGKRVLKSERLGHISSNISLSINYARSHISTPGVEIEEKEDSEGHTVAFCVDWRLAKDPQAAKHEAECVATYCEGLGLNVIRYETQPFFDVYPVSPDKGEALRDTMNELAVRNGVLYLGDSKTDNPAFRASNISLGVIHDESPIWALDCDYLVRFESVPDFLHALAINDLKFTPDFPMIKTNPNRRKK
jgi:trehalose-phosphatase